MSSRGTGRWDMKIPTLCLGEGMQPNVTLDWACWSEPGKTRHNTQNLAIEKFLQSFLVSVSYGTEYLSCSVPDLAPFLAAQLSCFSFCRELSIGGAKLFGVASWCWALCIKHDKNTVLSLSSESGGYWPISTRKLDTSEPIRRKEEPTLPHGVAQLVNWDPWRRWFLNQLC